MTKGHKVKHINRMGGTNKEETSKTGTLPGIRDKVKYTWQQRVQRQNDAKLAEKMKQRERECIRRGALNGRKPSKMADSDTQHNCGRIEDAFIPIGILSDEMSNTPLGQVLW